MHSRSVKPSRVKKHHFIHRVRGHHLYQKVALGVLLVFFSVFVQMCSTNFYADILQTPTAAPFDGTVSPIEKIPAWTTLTSDEWTATYDAIPSTKLVPFPKYTITELQTPIASLVWGDPQDDAIRNAKITFPVVYLGTYEGDFQENIGSHLAIDIKAPQGTPVRAIANGVAEKVSESSGGFGYHVVIRHDDAPDPDSPNNRIVLHSSYSHLSSISVSEGSAVQKGQIIGYVGHTGTATTNHLHFQIDRDSAAWHPYWAFTSAEMNAAGLSFFDAINAGLGIDQARTHTINPLVFVQTFENNAGVASTTVETTLETPVTEVVTETVTPSTTETTVPETVTVETTTVVVSEPAVETTVAVEPVEVKDLRFVFLHDGAFVPGVPEKITVAVKKGDSFVTTFEPLSRSVKLLIGRGAGTFDPATLETEDFVDGQASFALTGEDKGSIQIKATMGSNMTGVTVIESGIFSDVVDGDEYYDAIQTLKNDNIVQGYPDGSFKPLQSVSRVEALKFIFSGAEIPLEDTATTSLKFSDTDPKGWYAGYVQTAQKLKIIKGYPDGTFKPVNTVNRVEFLKMLFASAEIDVSDLVIQKNPFPDVDKNQWYAPYVVYAKQKGLVDPDVDKFEPNGAMTRGEVAQVLYQFRKKFK